MEKQGKVSIWIGKVDSNAKLISLTSEEYTEDGDMRSDFMEAFGIDYYDEQKKEVMFIKSSNKKSIFEVFSYSESFINKIIDKDWSQYNSYILIYDFEFIDKVQTVNNFSYIGSYNYK